LHLESVKRHENCWESARKQRENPLAMASWTWEKEVRRGGT
jgi:hypothetical protein